MFSALREIRQGQSKSGENAETFYSLLLDPKSTDHPHKTYTGALPPAGPRWPQSCSDWVWETKHIEGSLQKNQVIWVKLLYLLFRGILVAQLLKEPETKTSLAAPDHLNTVGLASVGLLLSFSRSSCQARNSCISCGTWIEEYQLFVPKSNNKAFRVTFWNECPIGRQLRKERCGNAVCTSTLRISSGFIFNNHSHFLQRQWHTKIERHRFTTWKTWMKFWA